MRNRTKGLVVALTAALLLALAVGTASANDLSVSEDRFNIAWEPIVLTNALGEVACDVTLEGSFHSRTIGKAPGTRLGHVTEIRIANCEGGAYTILDETLPWQWVFSSFTGTLPSISTIAVRTHGVALLVEIGVLAECLLQTDAAEPSGSTISLNGEGRAIAYTANEELAIALAGRFPCTLAGPASFGGSATFEDDEGGSLVFTLI
jgi:hypothetical protein